MKLEARGWLASLTFAAIATLSYPAWSAGVVDQSGPGAQVSPPGHGHGNAEGADIPVIPAPQAPGAAAGGPPGRADANANGISDSLETLIDQGGPGEKFDVIAVFGGPDAPGDARAAVAQSRAAVGQFAVTRSFSIINAFQASMTAAQIHALSSTPGLFRIQENGEVRAFDTYSNDDTGATDARNLPIPDTPYTGAGVTVCILDTGINAAHEQFNEGGATRITGFADFVNGQPSAYDDQGHGTHVAGIAAGDGSGGGLAAAAIGVAPGASIKAAKVLNANGQGFDADVIAGIQWCAEDPNVDIISMSLGGPGTDGTDPTSLAANCATDPSFDPSSCDTSIAPKIVVIAAGNSGAHPGTIGAPGVAENAITVGSFAEWSGDQSKIWQDEGVYLNPFSSRGPVSDGRIKPDITAPGSWVLSAYIGSNGEQSATAYAAASGTSMATPFVSGVIALMLEADSSLGGPVGGLPFAKVRQILEDTAIDRGPLDTSNQPVKDNEYGAGLIDAFAAVAEADGAASYSSPTEYPGYTHVRDSVANSGIWYYPDEAGFEVTTDDVSAAMPIAATLTTEGEVACYIYCWFATYWAPDLELVAEVQADPPNGAWSQVPADPGPDPNNPTYSAEQTLSTCPDSAECGGIGRVEVVHFIPDVAGRYRFRVYPYADAPNNGAGGTFDFEVSMGGATSGGGGTNSAPTASFTYGCTDLSCTFDASGSSDSDGTITSYAWDYGDGTTGSGSTASNAYPSNGTYTVTLTVTDDGNATGTDSQSVSVTDGSTGNSAPTASFTSTCTDTDLSCTFDASGSSDRDGTITSYAWDYGDGTTGSGSTASNTYPSNGTYTVTLTVTDDGNATGSYSQTVSVTTPVHIGGLSDLSQADGGRWTAIVEVLVEDGTGAPVNNVSVSGSWSNGTNGSGSCTTGATGDGRCTISKGNLKNNVSSVTFTISDNGVTPPAGYAHDSSADTATTITLSPGGGSTTNNPPTASFTYSCTDLTCDFDASGSSDSDGTISSYAWDFGDGNSGSGATPSHPYGSGSDYPVTLTVTDDGGATGTSAQTVSVSTSVGGGFSLTASGYKVQGKHTVDLDWNSSVAEITGGDIVIYRNDVLIETLRYTNGGDGTHTDAMQNKGGGTYRYTACDAEALTVCSNEATVTF